jgi:hypothetical protein
MKSYTTPELEEAKQILSSIQSKNPVIDYFLKKVKEEIKKNTGSVFVKAPDSYLKKLKREDVNFRLLKEGDPGYYPGMYGLFEKKTKKLLRRHTDLGKLGSMIQY